MTLKLATPRGLQTATNYYLGSFIKTGDAVSEFHSYAEYLYAGLLEGDPTTAVFNAQPPDHVVKYISQGKRKLYRPDFSVHFKAAAVNPKVVEIKSDTQYDTFCRLHCDRYTEYFTDQGYEYCVIRNSSVLEQSVLALNWIRLVQYLRTLSSVCEPSGQLKRQVMKLVSTTGEPTVGEVCAYLDAVNRDLVICAALLAIHQGHLSTELATLRFSMASRLRRA